MTASAENEEEEETDEEGSVLRELEDGIACFNNKVKKAGNLRRVGEERSAGTLRRPRRGCLHQRRHGRAVQQRFRGRAG
jgi:hypothetical protein